MIIQEVTVPAFIAYSVPMLGTISLAGVLGWPWWKRKNAYKSLNSVPSPPRHWLLGNIPQLKAAVKKKQLFQFLFDWSQKLGPIYVYWIGSPVLILSNPKTIEDTIINGTRDGNLVRSRWISAAWKDISGPILIGENGTEWKWRRKAWNPEFNAGALSKYIEVILQACTGVIDRIKEAKPSEAVQVDPLFIELTTRVIACLMLGIPVDEKIPSLEGPPLEIKKLYEAMSVVAYRFLRVAHGEKRWQKYLPTKSSRDYWLARQYLEKFLTPRVDLALQLRDNKQTDLGQVSPWFQQSMLVKIAAKESKYNRESLISEAIELLIAGIDTTAHTLSFAVGELASNPRVFQKAQSIVDKAWQSQGQINVESLKELNYIRAIVKETLRLYPVASGSTSLETIRDTVIDGIKVPQGTKVSWSMFGAGRNPEIYAQPEEFLPERWLEGDKLHNSLPMLNFGSGYHKCLGENLAMLESTIMLAQLLWYFHWELVNGRSSLENLQESLNIDPCDGMPLRFQLRELTPVA